MVTTDTDQTEEKTTTEPEASAEAVADANQPIIEAPVETPAAEVTAPATTEDAPPAVAPAPEAPIVTTPPVAAPSAEVARIQQLEKDNDAFQERIAQGELTRQAEVYRAQLIQDGNDEAAATNIARRELQNQQRAWEGFKANHSLRSEYANHFTSAFDIGEEFGVSAKDLSRLATVPEMRLEARRLKDSRVKDERISVLEKKQVPVQSLDSGVSESGGRSDWDIWSDYGNPDKDYNNHVEATAAGKRLGII